MRDTLVLFDIGSTLLRINFKRFYKEAAELSKDKDSEGFEEAYINSNLPYRLATAEITTREFLEELRKIINPKRDVTDEELITVVGRQLEEPIGEMVELKRKIYEAGYSVGVFSNISKLNFSILSDRCPQIFETFDDASPRIYSYRIGSLKPEPKGYREVKGYDNVIFIDDKESYLKTGIEQFGWKGILFTPYIDTSEAIRAVHSDRTIPDSKAFKIANSVEEVIEALREFGVKL